MAVGGVEIENEGIDWLTRSRMLQSKVGDGTKLGLVALL